MPMGNKIAPVLLALTLSFGALLSGCGSKETSSAGTVKGSITAVGSTALQPLVENAAKGFMDTNPEAQIQIQGGGSGTGLSQVLSGGADIGNSDIFAEEKKEIAPKAGELKDHKVAVVGIAAVVNSQVKLKDNNISKEDLIKVFTGKVANWKEIGGPDLQIQLVNRPVSSGTRATFHTFALDKNLEAQGITEESSGTVKKIVEDTPGAIGYLALSYIKAENTKMIALSLDGVAPTKEKIVTNDYPVWAYEHMYTKGEPTGLTKAFIDYMLSDAVQKNDVPKAGFIAITDMKVDRSAEGKITQK